MPTYHLYIANKNYSSWSFRPWLLMRQLGVPFVEHFHPLNGNSYRQPQWAAFSPTAHVPCLHALPDPNDNEEKQEEPIIVWESLAIAEFLADSHPSLSVWPSDPRARAWARSACAEMATSFHAIRNQMGMNVGIRVRLDPSLFSVADGDGK
ncbi:hypothetical protein VTJ04DRAFT_7975 [Mycothermus thermophilus]|uniref:uncharacterized protein n=1 Tax=Humicola insolens TaxID=85995 RepID=UPI0037432419